VDDPYRLAAGSAERLATALHRPHHDVAVVLGSGWAAAADAIGPIAGEASLADLGGFPPPTVVGHAGTLRSVTVGRLSVLVFVGRVHAYEGHPLDTVVHGVRTAIAAGCRSIVLTNAAGGINPSYAVGQPVLIRDHLNLTGRSPLTGPPPPPDYPGRFVALTDVYAPHLRAMARDAQPGLAEGVYACLPGPHYETPAEVRAVGVLGADLVGMSTVYEAIAARHLGADVLAISLVTNAAAGTSDEPPNHAEVVAVGEASGAVVGDLLAAVLRRMAAAAGT